MNKSDIVEAFREEVTKQNPWQPYTGPAGGQGWLNVVTGEKRYQENRPEPGEGMPEDHEGDIHEPDIDVEGFTPADPTAEDYQEFLEEGMEVEGEVDGAWAGGEIQAVGTNSVVIEDEVDGEPKEIAYEDLSENPVEFEPWDGYGDGWTEPPETTHDIYEGDVVEIYDLESGQYVEAEVTQTSMGDYLMAVDDEGNEYEVFLDDPDASGLLLTAHEDHLAEFGDELDQISEEEFAHMTEGDRVIYDPPDGPPIETELQETPSPDSHSDGWSAEILDAQGLPVTAVIEGDGGSLYDAVTWAEGSDGITWDGRTHWDEMEGLQVEFDHPVFGDIEGDVDVSEDPDGHTWFTVEHVPEPTPGDTFTAGGLDYEVKEVTHPEGYDQPRIVVEDLDDGMEYEWLHEDVVSEMDAEEVSLTDNEEHPFYVGDHLSATESPWDSTPSDLEGWDELTPGSTIALEDEDGNTVTDTIVESNYYDEFDQAQVVTASGLTLTDNELDTITGIKDVEEYPQVPIGAATDGWQNLGAAYSQNTGDSLLHVTEDGELRTGEISAFEDDGTAVVDYGLGDKASVPIDRAVAYADTGDPLPESSRMISSLGGGDVVTVEYVNPYSDDATDEMTGMVLESSNSSVTLVDDEGNSRTLSHDEVAVTDTIEDADLADYQAGDGMEMATDDIVSEITPEGGYTPTGSGQRLRKEDLVKWFWTQKKWTVKEDMQSLKADFKRYFPPDKVDTFYDDITGWKSSSGKAREIESAFTYAFDLDAPLRGQTDPDDPIPYTEEEVAELTKMAEVAGTLSQEYYEEHIGEWYRGGKAPSLVSAISDFLDDPTREEYDVAGMALNNGDNDPGNTWNQYRIAPGANVDTENVMLATDFMFNPEGNHGTEDEIWVTASDLKVAPDEIHINHDPSLNFAGDPESWDDYKVEQVGKEIARYAPTIFEEVGPGSADPQPIHGMHGDVTDSQLETMQTIAKEARRRGVDTSGMRDMQTSVETLMDQRGLDVGPTTDLPDGIGDITDYQAGMEVRGHNPYTQEVDDLYVDEVWPEEGIVSAEDEMGNVLELDPHDIDEITWADEPYGEGVEDITVDEEWVPDDFHEGDKVRVLPYGSNGHVQDAVVMEVRDNGTIKVSSGGKSDFFDLKDPTENDRIAPYGAADEGDPESEGSDVPTKASAYTPFDNPSALSADDVDTGDYVYFVPDAQQYGEGVVGQVTETVDMAGGPSFTVEDAQSLGDEAFPLNSYTGDMSELGGYAKGPDDEDEDLGIEGEGMIGSMDDVDVGTGVYVPEWNQEVTVSDVTDEGMVVGADASEEVAVLQPDDVVHPSEADDVEPATWETPDPSDVNPGDVFYNPVYGKVEINEEPVAIGDRWVADVSSEQYPDLQSLDVPDLSPDPVGQAVTGSEMPGVDLGDTTVDIGDTVSGTLGDTTTQYEVVDIEDGTPVIEHIESGNQWTPDQLDDDIEFDVVEDDTEPTGGHISVDHVHDAEPGMHEEFNLTGIPGEGEAQVEVIEPAEDPGFDPYYVQSKETGVDWIIWPDGEIE